VITCSECSSVYDQLGASCEHGALLSSVPSQHLGNFDFTSFVKNPGEEIDQIIDQNVQTITKSLTQVVIGSVFFYSILNFVIVNNALKGRR